MNVKLDNILVFRSDFSNIKLCDFGSGIYLSYLMFLLWSNIGHRIRYIQKPRPEKVGTICVTSRRNGQWTANERQMNDQWTANERQMNDQWTANERPMNGQLTNNRRPCNCFLCRVTMTFSRQFKIVCTLLISLLHVVFKITVVVSISSEQTIYILCTSMNIPFTYAGYRTIWTLYL